MEEFIRDQERECYMEYRLTEKIKKGELIESAKANYLSKDEDIRRCIKFKGKFYIPKKDLLK